MMLKLRRIALPFTAIALAAIALAGCSAGSGGSGTVGTADGVVKIEGPLIGQDATRLVKSWSAWEKANHIKIEYTGDANFNEQIGGEAQQGNAPDLAIFGQPGLINDLSSRGYIKALPSTVKSTVASTFPSQWARYTTTNGTDYAAPLLATLNGWVFYSPAAFAKQGLAVPTTWNQLLTETEYLRANTSSQPWCEGFSSGASSGQLGANWVGDMVLRDDGAAVYDKWVTHKIKFDSPEVSKAFADVGEILQNKDWVNAGFGSVASINSTSSSQIAAALLDGKCLMSVESTSFLDYLPKMSNGTETVSPNGALWGFLLPPITAGTTPLTVSGDFVAAFSNDSDTVKVQNYLASLSWAKSRMRLGNAISPAKGVDSTSTPDIFNGALVTLMQGADPKDVRLSASDLMPSIVGDGTFLTGIVKWVDGSPSAKVLPTIDGSWPKS